MDSNLFRKPDSFMEENNVDDAKKGESEDSEVIAEVARQRDQIRLLQNAVEDQSRILREISHQLKKGWGRVITTECSSGWFNCTKMHKGLNENNRQEMMHEWVFSGAPNDNIAQNHLNIALMNVF